MFQYLKKMWYFFLPIFLLFGLAIILYLKSDPFFDFSSSKKFRWVYSYQRLNDISTKNLLSTKINYNSFILGSSRSCGVYGCYLETKIPDSKFFHFADWVENIGGVLAKLQFLDSQGYQLKNIIIYLDTDKTFEGEGSLTTEDHYEVTKQSKVAYKFAHFVSFFSFFNLEKFKILTGKGEESGYYVNQPLDTLTNDYNHICSADVIKNYGFAQNDEVFRNKIDSLKSSGFLYSRPVIVAYNKPQISVEEEERIKKIIEVLKKHNSNYYIVITPLFDQRKFNSEDLKILKKYFGKRLFDFSGKNSITENIYNYPDRLHFQNYISKQIIDSVLNDQRNK